MIKKISLFLIILLEVIIGSFFLYRYYKFSQKEPIIAVLKAENININTSSELKYYYELKPNIIELDHPGWLEEKAIYTYNNDGLNERYNYKVEKEENVFRIIILGDSYTFGHFVSTPYNWTELLEDELNKTSEICPNKTFEVINLGVGGYDVSYIVERYERKGQKYNPDLIVWFESNSGFFRNKELLEPIVRKCSRNNKDVENNIFVYGECFYQAEEKLKSKYGLDGLAKINNDYFEKFFKITNSQKTMFFGFEKNSLSKENLDAFYLRIKTYPLMDFRQIIPDIRNLGYLLPDGHPNKEGHKTIKEIIFESIKLDIKKICF